MSTVLLLFLLLMVLTIGLMGPGVALAGPPAQTVTGGGTIDTYGPWPGVEIKTEISAQIDADGVASGMVQGVALYSGKLMLHVDIDCLDIEDNKAWFSGTIKHIDYPGWAGQSFIGGVIDRGDGHSVKDGRSYFFIGFPYNCEFLHPDPEIFEWTRGDVQVR